MAEHGPTTMELVEVTSEDILAERRGLYDAFMTGTTYAAAATVGVLVLLWIFVV